MAHKAGRDTGPRTQSCFKEVAIPQGMLEEAIIPEKEILPPENK